MRTVARFTSILIAGCALWIVGCGSDDSGTDRTPATTVEAPPTAVPTPVVTGDRVNSTAVGYEATIPPGWRLRPNIISAANFRGDAYFAPDPSPAPSPDTPQTNIAVGCEPITLPVEDLTTELDGRVQVLNRLGRTNILTREHTPVDDIDSIQIDYRYVATSDSTEFTIDSRDVFFLSEGCKWTITLTTASGQLDEHTATFEQFLSSVSINV